MKTSITNFLLLYTIIQIIDILQLYQLYQCYETPIDPRTKPDFQSLHLHNFQPNKRKRSRRISLSRNSIDKAPYYQEISEELFLNRPSTRL